MTTPDEQSPGQSRRPRTPSGGVGHETTCSRSPEGGHAHQKPSPSRSSREQSSAAGETGPGADGETGAYGRVAGAGSPELVALMLADARLPTGGHTQSGGLEPAVRAGLGAEGARLRDVASYAADRLRTIVRVEAATAVVARQLALDGELVEQAEAAWAARTPSQALRAASRRQGRAYLRLAARVWPRTTEYLKADAEIARPVVVGVVAAVTGLSAEQTARLIGYDDAQTVVAASLKLLPVDPADAATWLLKLHPDIEELVTAVSRMTTPAEIPAYGAPLVEVFAQAHAVERMRLFHA